MAEVVGLVASVITVAGFAAKVSKIISRARAFGEIPRQLYALKNEITDLEVVLRQMGDAIQDNAQTPNTQTQSLEQILERTKTHLADIAKSLERMVDTRETGNIKFISKSRILLKEKAIFQRYQDAIHGVKMTLSIMLGTSNSYAFSIPSRRQTHDQARLTVLTGYQARFTSDQASTSSSDGPDHTFWASESGTSHRDHKRS